MKAIDQFLAKFQSLTPPNDAVKTAIVKALKDTLDITCKKDQVSIARGVVYIQGSSIMKNIIQINRSKVLEHLFERLPKTKDTVRDIR